jgi:TolB-like protein/DNA-binding winged helix-turn-helix (wHTH) protein/Tfp pilus assembly protein PilF
MRIRCQVQPIQVLVALLERPGELFTREELRQRVWPEDTFVDFDHALNTAVKKIRAALNDEADSPRYLETVPRRGYRFIAPVQTEMTPGRAAEEPPKELREPEELPAGKLDVLCTAVENPFYYRPETHRPLFNRRVVLLAAALIGVVGGGYYWSNHRARASDTNTPNRTMVAVLPFENMTNDPAQEYFSDGMTEETISQLGRLNSQNMGVIARTSAMKYKHSGKGAREIGRELNSDYLVEGSIRREGSRVRVVAQLIRVADQSPRWSHQFDYQFGEPLYIETDAATEIANMVHTALEPATRRRVMKADSTDFYLRGLAESNVRTQEGLDRIFHAFEEGMKKDPNCAPPYAALARIYERGADLGLLKPTDAYAKARVAAEKAIEIDPSNPEAHIYLADALLTVNYDWGRAQAEIQKALTLNVNDPNAHEWNGIFLSLQGRTDQAIQELRTAVELDPLNAEYLVTLGNVLMAAGRPVEAGAQLNAAISLDPASDGAHFWLAEIYASDKHYAEAINEATTALFLRGQRDQALKVKAAFEKSGYEAAKEMALREQLSYLLDQREKRFVSAFDIAVLYSLLGERKQSLAWLQTAYQQRDVRLLCLRESQNRKFASVKDAPEFQAILRELHYPQ